MIDNPWRRVVLVLLLAGLGAFYLLTRGLKLGLDLQGGTRLVYTVDIEKAIADGDLPKDAKAEQVIPEMIDIISRRIDPQGVKDPSITQAGSDRILVELPGSDSVEAEQIQARIQDLGALEMRMVAYAEYAKLPDGETFDLDAEKKRLDAWIAKPENKNAVDHDPLAAIKKFNNIPAGRTDGRKSRWLRWWPMFRRGSKDKDGKTVYSYETHPQAHPDGNDPTKPSFLPINYHEPRYFTGEDLVSKQIGATTDPRTSLPAIAYEIVPSKAAHYGDLSEENIGKAKAIALNGYVRIAPTFNSRIDGRGIISGGFTRQEVGDLVIVLKTGSLKIVPQLESESTIGPSLGQIAIEKGELSIATGGILIVIFMLAYYRLTGCIAIVGLLVNMALIFGGLAFMRATLTLPGLAGIVLTIGMAVDANILIFERIREEKERGTDLLRAVKAGFEKAMSTILDANITTFLTGLILYNVGIGPIKGFAVTLMFGIVASVFSAIFVSKIMFHFLLAREKIQSLTMARLFAQPSFAFLKVRKIAAVLSITLVLGGLVAFFSTPGQTKYGLDFTGGAAFQVALREAQTQKQITDALSADSEFSKEFENPQISTVQTAGVTGETDSETSYGFLIKLKLTPEQRDTFKKRQDEAKARNETYAPPYIDMVQRILAGKLANAPFSDVKSIGIPEEGYSIVGAVMHAAKPIAVEKVRGALATKFNNVKVVAVDANGEKQPSLAAGKDLYIDLRMDLFDPKDQANFDKRVPIDLREALTAENLGLAAGETLVLSNPIPESSLIGSRAVGDLRDAAIGAMLLSLLIIVMYIRIRFHEYKYGLGACAALVHDVVIALGIVTLLNSVGLIHAEIDLAMIAAFLTIIGYSLNDTIVVFDRIRENLELQKKLDWKMSFEELVDKSVNQTLSRTVLTSITTFLVVACLFVYNYGAGSVLEGFAFSMMIGIIVGTYSSIWVANPVVVWLTGREANAPSKPNKKTITSAPRGKEQPEPV